jgi:hypothetical protein
MTTFFLAALDERIAASAPVSGTFSTHGWVKQRLSFAHCDCQNPVNTYGLMYSEIGALTAPRKQLLVNADADRGFPMDAFSEMAEKMQEIYRLYNAVGNLRTAVTRGAHEDTEEIRLPVFSFFLKEFLGVETPLVAEGPIDKPPPESLVCFRDGAPLNERLTQIDEELIPAFAFHPTPARNRQERIKDLVASLRSEVFRYFPEKDASFSPIWTEGRELHGRFHKQVSFNSFEDLRVKGVYSLPGKAAERGKLPAFLIIDHRRGMPRWGNEQPLEVNHWGDRAVLMVETLDRGTRSLERNLRSFNDDDLLHHMKRQAMVVGTTIESMQLYEVMRSLAFLRSLPEVDPSNITIVGKGETGIHGLYAALMSNGVQRVIVGSPPGSHRTGPTRPTLPLDAREPLPTRPRVLVRQVCVVLHPEPIEHAQRQRLQPPQEVSGALARRLRPVESLHAGLPQVHLAEVRHHKERQLRLGHVLPREFDLRHLQPRRPQPPQCLRLLSHRPRQVQPDFDHPVGNQAVEPQPANIVVLREVPAHPRPVPPPRERQVPNPALQLLVPSQHYRPPLPARPSGSGPSSSTPNAPGDRRACQ